MGSGSTKVRKLNKASTLDRSDEVSTKNSKSDQFSDETSNNNNSKDTASSNDNATTVNRKPPKIEDHWVGPGMVDEPAPTVSTITSEALILGKKRLKSTSQSNNNCNKRVCDGEDKVGKDRGSFWSTTTNQKNRVDNPLPKPLAKPRMNTTRSCAETLRDFPTSVTYKTDVHATSHVIDAVQSEKLCVVEIDV